jgi:phosphate-selective porin OprO and OprP
VSVRRARVGLLLPLLWSTAARAAEVPVTPPGPAQPAAAGPAPAATSTDTATPAETQAAAAQRAAQDAEAQVIELRRQIDALERQRASYDDVRRRLDQIDARQGEIDRRAQAAADANPPETSVIRFHDDGFSIRSPDNGFYLHPLLRVQAIYTGELAKQGPLDTAPPDASGFSLGRAEVILEGHVGGPFFQYRFQFDAAESPSLKDAYVAWRPIRMLSIWAGQFKVPYGLQRQYWKAELEFIDVSAAMAAFSLERDLGLMAVAGILPGRLTVQAALVNGSGANVPNDNFDLAYALRIVATPFGPLPVTEGDIEGHVRPLLSIGAAGYYNLVPTDIVARTGNPAADTDIDGNGRIDNVAIWQGGLELRAIYRGISLQGELFRRLEDPGAAGPNRDFWGGYLQGSYFILPHRLELAARLSHTDLPLYGATVIERAREGSWQDEQSGLVAAYVRGHRIKAQAEYSHLTSNGESAPTINRVQGAIQVGF